MIKLLLLQTTYCHTTNNNEIGLVLKFHNAEENLQNWKEKPNQTGGVIFVNGGQALNCWMDNRNERAYFVIVLGEWAEIRVTIWETPNHFLASFFGQNCPT